MTDKTLPEVTEKPKAAISSIWFLPILAALIGLWLIYKAVIEAPVLIEVEFDSGEGIEVGKTVVRYEGIEIGKVKNVRVQNDLIGVVATIAIDRRAEKSLNENTLFWIVKPEVTLSGVTGLGTVFSGNYIAMRIGDGEPIRYFKGLSSSPPRSMDEAGLHLTLKASDLGSLSKGSPIIYKKITIGDVQSYQLTEGGESVDVDIYIKPEFATLVKTKSRFWNASGLSIKGGITGFDIRTESLTALLRGGIGLSTFEVDLSSPAAANGDSFKLYDDFTQAQTGVEISVELPVIAGLSADVTKVVYRGIPIGEVQALEVNDDLTKIYATLTLFPRMADYINNNTRLWVREPDLSLSDLSGVSRVLEGIEIEIDFDGAPPDDTRAFIALNKPPILKKDEPGLHFSLTVDSLESVKRGMDITYRSIVVGSIIDYRLNKTDNNIILDAHIESEYADLVNKSSRFWDESGIQIKGGLEGINIRTSSVSSVLLGAIAFDTPNKNAEKIAKDARFRLFEDYESANTVGVPITLNFSSGEGLKEGTAIKYQGIEVGRVTSVTLNKTLSGAVVVASLTDAADTIARKNTQFWLVKPELGLTRTANLDTLLTGEYITFKPGDGELHYRFTALDSPPVVSEQQAGLTIILRSDQLSSIKEGLVVTYRGVTVGKVTGHSLSENANDVFIYVNIDARYAPLVRQGSKFWNASGLDIGFKLFGGATIKSDSIESILAGGIAFATPDDNIGPIVEPNTVFELNEKSDEQWLKWQPSIPLNIDSD